jgi:hypothetical protein
MYVPKSQIIPNQHTNGNELEYKSTREMYMGYYYILSNNTLFSGKNPNDGIPRELQPISTNTKDNQPIPQYDNTISNTSYDYIRSKKNIPPPSISLIEPSSILPSPQYPSFIRYFLKRANNSIFIEVDKSVYDKIKNKDKDYNWPIYIPFELPWTTGGTSRSDIYNINKGIVDTTEYKQKLYGLSLYITNYTQFAI